MIRSDSSREEHVLFQFGLFLAGADPPESGSPLLWKVLFQYQDFSPEAAGGAFQLFINGIDGIQAHLCKG